MKEVEIQEAGTAIKENVLNLEPNISNNQRLFSVVAGSALLLDAIVRKQSLTRGLAAGYLLFRGATGYCAITDVSENAVPKAKNALENARNKAGEAYDNVLEQAHESYEKYSGQAKDAVEGYKNKAKDTAEDYTNKAKDAVSDYKNQAKDAVNGATDKVKEMADKIMHLNRAGEKYDINIETQVRVHSNRQEVYDYWQAGKPAQLYGALGKREAAWPHHQRVEGQSTGRCCQYWMESRDSGRQAPYPH